MYNFNEILYINQKVRAKLIKRKFQLLIGYCLAVTFILKMPLGGIL